MKSGGDKHRLLIEHLPDAFAYHQIITDSSGQPVDYIFLDVNLAFEGMTGLDKDKVSIPGPGINREQGVNKW